MSEFEINIRTKADLAAAKKSEEALKSNVDAAGALAAANREIDSTLRDAKAPAEQQAAALGNIVGKKASLREVIRALTRDFPVLGRVAQFALNPLAAGIALLTVAMGKMRTGVTHVQNALLDLQDQSRRTDFVSKQQDDLNRAGRDASQYARQLRGIATAAQSITDRTNESIAAARALATAQAALDSEEHALRIEQINELERKKTITAEEGLRRRSQLEREFRALQRQHAAELEADEIKQRQKELEDIRTELPWMRRHASEARAPVDTLSKRKIMLEGRIGDSRADFEREVKRLEEFEAEVERLEKRKSLVESAALLPSARDKADRQRGVVEATRRSIRSDREQLATIEAELDQAVEILTDKRSALRSAVTRATDLEKQIPKMRSAATDAQSQRERVGAVIEKRESIVTQGQIETAREREEKARRDQEAADERERQQRLKRDQEAINSGRPLSFNAEPVRRSLDQAEGSFDGLNQAVLDFARHMVADAAQTKNELADLRRGFGKIESRRVDSMS
jgi:hypothetical protein